MAHPIYRKAPGTEWIVVILTLLMVASQIALVPILGPRQIVAMDLIYFALPMVVAFVLGWVILGRIRRKKMERLAQSLKAFGLQANLTPTPEKLQLLWNYVKPLEKVLDLRGGSQHLKWFATIDGLTDPLCLFEFRFVTGSGRYSQEHIRTVITWLCPILPAPDKSPGDLPGFVMSRLPWLQRRLHKGSTLVLPGHESLTKTWTCYGDPETATRFLKPAVLAELAQAPQGECWYLGHGWFCCCFRNALHPDDVSPFVERSRRMLALAAEDTRA